MVGGLVFWGWGLRGGLWSLSSKGGGLKVRVRSPGWVSPVAEGCGWYVQTEGGA